MIMDERTEFCDADVLTTTTGTNNEGDIIDTGPVARDMGAGQPIYLVVEVTTAVTSAGAATVRFQLVSDATSTIATDGSQTIHWQSAAIGKADLVAGYQIVVEVPQEAPVWERYMAVQAVVATAALTAGAINAFLTLDKPKHASYPDAAN